MANFPSSFGFTANSHSSSPPPVKKPSIGTIAARPISRSFSDDIQFVNTAVKTDELIRILKIAETEERKAALEPLGLKATPNPRGGFYIESTTPNRVIAWCNPNRINHPNVRLGLLKVGYQVPPFIDKEINFNATIVYPWAEENHFKNLSFAEKQVLFKANLEQILLMDDENERDNALAKIGLKAEHKTFQGVSGWFIQHIETKPGFFGNHFKQGWITGVHTPIAKVGDQPLVFVPAGAIRHAAPPIIKDASPNSPKNLEAVARKAWEEGRLMDMGDKGAYVLLPEASSAIIIPAGSGEEGLDFSKIQIFNIMNSETGEDITNPTMLKILVETLMDCQSEIDKLTKGVNCWVTFNHDWGGQLVIKVIPHNKNEYVKDLEDGGETVDIKSELQKAYASRLEKGPSGVAKKRKAVGPDVEDDPYSPRGGSHSSSPDTMEQIRHQMEARRLRSQAAATEAAESKRSDDPLPPPRRVHPMSSHYAAPSSSPTPGLHTGPLPTPAPPPEQAPQTQSRLRTAIDSVSDFLGTLSG